MSRQFDEELRHKIISLRQKKNWSQSELANKLEVDNSVLSKIESGTRKVSALEIEKLATMFDVTTDYLLGHNDTPEWATDFETIELQELLRGNHSLAYNEGEVTEEDRKAIDNMITGYYWHKQQEGNE